MKVLEPGSVCIKTAGREAGKKVVVVEEAGENFVVVGGPGVRKRKCNIAHLFPTGKKVGAGKIKKEDLEKIE